MGTPMAASTRSVLANCKLQSYSYDQQNVTFSSKSSSRAMRNPPLAILPRVPRAGSRHTGFVPVPVDRARYRTVVARCYAQRLKCSLFFSIIALIFSATSSPAPVFFLVFSFWLVDPREGATVPKALGRARTVYHAIVLQLYVIAVTLIARQAGTSSTAPKLKRSKIANQEYELLRILSPLIELICARAPFLLKLIILHAKPTDSEEFLRLR